MRLEATPHINIHPPFCVGIHVKTIMVTLYYNQIHFVPYFSVGGGLLSSFLPCRHVQEWINDKERLQPRVWRGILVPLLLR
ncbi:hypothetical protein EUGRSUZ_E00887 [Eucalyptus grandis]|uniref:Uncharacterized protein n=2 Tax=Eucalyptus grandis TaxID=71139 RepID=A0ACC3KTV0_EUCGR|nr:hypothetical protein EUGRSUZ_E00887 [Eucalyptus grandis]